MNRRELLGLSLAAVGGIFAPRFGRWYRRGSGLVVPDRSLTDPPTDADVFTCVRVSITYTFPYTTRYEFESVDKTRRGDVTVTPGTGLSKISPGDRVWIARTRASLAYFPAAL